jgi:hypothetical protein
MRIDAGAVLHGLPGVGDGSDRRSSRRVRRRR